ncbi:hypothetical protein Tco_1492799 [Tanacetum coccineum]
MHRMSCYIASQSQKVAIKCAKSGTRRSVRVLIVEPSTKSQLRGKDFGVSIEMFEQGRKCAIFEKRSTTTNTKLEDLCVRGSTTVAMSGETEKLSGFEGSKIPVAVLQQRTSTKSDQEEQDLEMKSTQNIESLTSALIQKEQDPEMKSKEFRTSIKSDQEEQDPKMKSTQNIESLTPTLIQKDCGHG